MVEYTEPLVSDIDPKLAPQIAAALYAQAQLLSLLSYVLGRRPGAKFYMPDLIDALNESVALTVQLRAEELQKVYDVSAMMLFTSLRMLLPSDLQQKQSSRQEPVSVRVKLADTLQSLSRLIDSSDADDPTDNTVLKTLIESILALEAGETTDFLKPSDRKGKYIAAHTVAMIKYEFFLMRPLLMAAGFNSSETNSLYAKYATVVWDSASRWKADVREILSERIRQQIEEKVAILTQDGNKLTKRQAEYIMNDLGLRMRNARNPS